MIAELLALNIQGIAMNTLRPAACRLAVLAERHWNTGEIAARAGNCVRVLPHACAHCAGGREDLIGQQLEGILDPDSSTSPYRGLLIGSFRIFIQFILCGAGGARTHDRRIMRTTAPCIVRTTARIPPGRAADGADCTVCTDGSVHEAVHA